MDFFKTNFLNNIQNKYLAIYQYIACFCLFVFITNKVFALTYLDYNILRHLAKNLCYLFAIFNLLIFIKEKKIYIDSLSFLFLIIGFFNKKYTQQTDVLVYTILVIAFAKMKVNLALKTYLFTVGFLLISIILFSILDLSEDHFFGIREGVIRQAFGFKHANYLGGLIFFYTMILWTSLNDKIFNNLLCIALFVGEYLFIEHYIDSRSAQTMCIIAIITVLLYSAYPLYSDKFNNKILRTITKFITVNFILFSASINIFVVYIYSLNCEFGNYLNELLSTRLSLQNNALNNFNVSLFGDFLYARIADVDPFSLGSVSAVKYNYLDSFYFYVLYRWGLCSLLVFLISTLLIALNSFKAHQYKINIALICFSIYAISESFYFMLCYNIFIYLCFTNFTKSKDKQLSKIPNCNNT